MPAVCRNELPSATDYFHEHYHDQICIETYLKKILQINLNVEIFCELLSEIRECIIQKCIDENKPYILSIGIGFDEFLGGQDTFSECMQRADSKLYLDKEYCKSNGKSTICK